MNEQNIIKAQDNIIEFLHEYIRNLESRLYPYGYEIPVESIETLTKLKGELYACYR